MASSGTFELHWRFSKRNSCPALDAYEKRMEAVTWVGLVIQKGDVVYER